MKNMCSMDSSDPGRSCRYHKKPLKEKCHGTDQRVRGIIGTFRY